MLLKLISQGIWNPIETHCKLSAFDAFWIRDSRNLNHFGCTRFGTFDISDCKYPHSFILRNDINQPVRFGLIIGIHHD